jgi:hypothetical protein
MSTIKIESEVETFLRNALETRLAQLSEAQRGVFKLLYPTGVRSDQLEDAIDKCDRTIRKNEADPTRLTKTA